LKSLQLSGYCFKVNAGILSVRVTPNNRDVSPSDPDLREMQKARSVETCKFDDDGEAMHEECAVSRLTPNNHTAQQEQTPFSVRRLQMLFGRSKY
jgi:hypothetical protein